MEEGRAGAVRRGRNDAGCRATGRSSERWRGVWHGMPDGADGVDGRGTGCRIGGWRGRSGHGTPDRAGDADPPRETPGRADGAGGCRMRRGPMRTAAAPPAAQGEAEAWLREGAARHARGDLAGAEALYRKVLRARPEDANAENLLGVAARQRGGLAAALAHGARAVALRPGSGVFLANHGAALAEAGRLEEAVVRRAQDRRAAAGQGREADRVRRPAGDRGAVDRRDRPPLDQWRRALTDPPSPLEPAVPNFPRSMGEGSCSAAGTPSPVEREGFGSNASKGRGQWVAVHRRRHGFPTGMSGPPAMKTWRGLQPGGAVFCLV